MSLYLRGTLIGGVTTTDTWVAHCMIIDDQLHTGLAIDNQPSCLGYIILQTYTPSLFSSNTSCQQLLPQSFVTPSRHCLSRYYLSSLIYSLPPSPMHAPSRYFHHRPSLSFPHITPSPPPFLHGTVESHLSCFSLRLSLSKCTLAGRWTFHRRTFSQTDF